eukprot:222890-Prymnesium_polylepis.2
MNAHRTPPRVRAFSAACRTPAASFFGHSAPPYNVTSRVLQVPGGMHSESTQIRVKSDASGMVRSTPSLYRAATDRFTEHALITQFLYTIEPPNDDSQLLSYSRPASFSGL